MIRSSFVRSWLVALLGLVVGAALVAACAPAVRKQPRQRLPSPPLSAPGAEGAPEDGGAAIATAGGQTTDAGAPAPVQELLEVRVLVVSYAGADNARETVTRTKDQALERAQMIARMAKSGDRLAELVRKYSDRAGASEDLGLFRLRPAQPGAFGREVGQAALALAPGSISDPVETPSGYFVIERRTDPPTGPTKVSARHILISYAGAEHAIPGVKRTEAEARTLADQIAKDAKAPGANWAELAKYTDEPGSKETGGDLGSFARGQMVPAFERIAFALAVGQVSDVVQTPFGFHVITRYE
jgi:NIMA-interacting peptidyl-prolyl cis-trans isomerase 1